MTRQIALLELHDARLEAVTVRPGGVVVFLFNRVGAYVPAGPDRYDIWSHRAELLLDGVSTLDVAGRIPDDAWIVDDSITGPGAQSLQLLEVLQQGRSIERFELAFRDGTRVSLTGRRMAMRLIDDGAVVDSWEGPL